MVFILIWVDVMIIAASDNEIVNKTKMLPKIK